jgi:hypothetical protein
MYDLKEKESLIDISILFWCSEISFDEVDIRILYVELAASTHFDSGFGSASN